MAPRTIPVYTENNDYQRFDVLKRNRNKRFQYKQFFVEGVEPINKALENGWKVLSFVYSRERQLSDWANNILKHSKADTHYEMPNSLMDKLSDREDSSELIAILDMPEPDINKIKLGEIPLVVAFDRPSNIGNLGTLIRSCDAFKADGLIVTGHSIDIYDPVVIRSSLGAFFTMPIVKLESHLEIMQWVETQRKVYNDFQIVGTSVKTDIDIVAQDFRKPTLLIIGNETYGMSKGYREICDSIVKIPIYGAASSLNVSCAASIVLYEIDRQRRAL